MSECRVWLNGEVCVKPCSHLTYLFRTKCLLGAFWACLSAFSVYSVVQCFSTFFETLHIFYIGKILRHTTDHKCQAFGEHNHCSLSYIFISTVKRLKYLIAINRIYVIVNSRLITIFIYSKCHLIYFCPIIFSHFNALFNMVKWIAC